MKSIVGSGKIIQNPACCVSRTVVHSDDFEVWIVNFRERLKRAR
jgi:hypothetical protein